jgi:hypothetical protein
MSGVGLLWSATIDQKGYIEVPLHYFGFNESTMKPDLLTDSIEIKPNACKKDHRPTAHMEPLRLI